MASMSLELQSEFGADLFFLSASKHPKGTACAGTDSGHGMARVNRGLLQSVFLPQADWQQRVFQVSDLSI